MAGLVEASTRIGIAGGASAARAGNPVLRHHALARRGERGPELLRVALLTGEEVLPLFSSGETAQAFLVSRGPAGTWYARECYAGELVSLLLGLYAGIDGVLLNPVHEDSGEGYAPENFMSCESFVGYLLGYGQEVSFRPDPRRVACAGAT